MFKPKGRELISACAGRDTKQAAGKITLARACIGVGCVRAQAGADVRGQRGFDRAGLLGLHTLACGGGCTGRHCGRFGGARLRVSALFVGWVFRVWKVTWKSKQTQHMRWQTARKTLNYRWKLPKHNLYLDPKRNSHSPFWCTGRGKDFGNSPHQKIIHTSYRWSYFSRFDFHSFPSVFSGASEGAPLE